MHEILDSKLFDAFARTSSNTFVYVSDMKTNLTRWSASAVEYFDLEGEYIYDVNIKWVSLVHPDDRQMYSDDLMAVFTGKSEYHNCQYRVMNRYSEYVWVECRGAIIKDENGEPMLFAGTLTRIDHQSKYDSLTHLLTGYELFRKPFDDNGTLLLVGIDNFRNINSQYGLVYGNKVLLNLTEILVANAQDATVYRFRGDEFVVYGKNKTTEQMIQLFVQVYNICSDPNIEKNIVGFSLSAGIVEFNEGNNDSTDILGKAELSIAHAKELKQLHYAVYSEEIEAKHNRKNKVLEALAKSIKNDFKGFRLVFQPILSNEGDTVVACESLLRWDAGDPEIGNCYPDEFIPLLEGSGGIIDVGYFVMREAIRHAAKWQKVYKRFNVTFNVSYLQLEDANFVPAIIETLEKYNVDASCITVELTESEFAKDAIMVKNSFEQLKKHGVLIALDDFGTGNSSFWTLHKIDIDIVKLDQTFIRGLDKSENEIDLAIIESVCLMCDRIGCRTVAEGVENTEIKGKLGEFKFTGLQGYLFSRPVEECDFEKFMDDYSMKL